MKVTRIETFLVGREWNNLIIARAHTDKGITGLGEGTLQWQARTVAAAIDHMASRYVLGSSPFGSSRRCIGTSMRAAAQSSTRYRRHRDRALGHLR